MNESARLNELIGAVGNLPASPNKDAALTFLNLPDVRLLTRRWNTTQSAAHWLRIYGIKFSNAAAKRGTTFYGGQELLERLKKLPSHTPVRMAGFEATGGLGLFWLDAMDQLIGFAIASGPN